MIPRVFRNNKNPRSVLEKSIIFSDRAIPSFQYKTLNPFSIFLQPCVSFISIRSRQRSKSSSFKWRSVPSSSSFSSSSSYLPSLHIVTKEKRNKNPGVWIHRNSNLVHHLLWIFFFFERCIVRPSSRWLWWWQWWIISQDTNWVLCDFCDWRLFQWTQNPSWTIWRENP